MSTSTRMMGSDYMHWAKTRSSARFNLAVSGMLDLPFVDLQLDTEEFKNLELTRGGGYGYQPLQEALAKRLEVGVDSIVAATGTSLANHLAMAALVHPGNEVLIERPTYEPLLAVASYLGATIKRFERRFEDNFKIIPQEVERNITSRTRLIVITNLHNPSGVLTDQEILREIGDVARRAQAHVLVDEVYLETLFEQRHQTAFHLGDEFVVTSSLTKAFGLSGLRCGWIVAAPDLAERIWRLNDLFGVMAAHPAEQLSVIALQRMDQISARARSLLERNRELVNRFLDSRSDLEAVRPQHGTIVFPRLRQANTEKFIDLLRSKYETSVVPGRFFEMPNHFRLGFSGPTENLSGG
ncbi:MAG TPA: pyridoxal phosphate-dependent aminotransferase, partial [Pyrinomonadaceae bacterium]|nr:pyridoxal phosphate-dependent aminotransferase [Pyrinomonadaceae bacterium]